MTNQEKIIVSAYYEIVMTWVENPVGSPIVGGIPRQQKTLTATFFRNS